MTTTSGYDSTTLSTSNPSVTDLPTTVQTDYPGETELPTTTEWYPTEPEPTTEPEDVPPESAVEDCRNGGDFTPHPDCDKVM